MRNHEVEELKELEYMESWMITVKYTQMHCIHKVTQMFLLSQDNKMWTTANINKYNRNSL